MRIAIVEDNRAVARGIAYRLQDRGHATDVLHDGGDADDFLNGDGNDLIVLDVNLPTLSGMQVLRNLRARGDARPVLLLTANDQVADRVAGLDAGADDYLVKPFSMEELEARLRALARREATAPTKMLEQDGLVLDPTGLSVRIGGTDLDLPRRELMLLEALLRQRGRTVSKSALMDRIYGTGADIDASAIEVHVSRLRKRLKPHGFEIQVSRGLGYRLARQEIS
ncbi:response regulator transcription factor [Aestuariibius insulae]|uniref:response regulator transcription factor n=1 Tax=Aestuariibius insulae TaxID=2058287 RepID=UPI00345E6F19